jgi:hypothetical protein
VPGPHTARTPLPRALESLLWDHDAERLDWETDRDLIVSRALASGGWEACRWVRERLGDAGLRAWIERHRGRGLSAPRLRFWEILLDLEHAAVSRWLDERRGDPWAERVGRP